MEKLELGSKVSRAIKCVVYVTSKQPEDGVTKQLLLVARTAENLLDSSDSYQGIQYLAASAVLNRMLKHTMDQVEDFGTSNGILAALRGAVEDAVSAVCMFITWTNFPLRRAQAIADRAGSAVVTADAILEAQTGYTFAPVTDWPVGEDDDEVPISQVGQGEVQCEDEDWLVDNISHEGEVIRRAGESLRCTRPKHSIGPHVVHATDGKPIHMWFRRHNEVL